MVDGIMVFAIGIGGRQQVAKRSGITNVIEIDVCVGQRGSSAVAPLEVVVSSFRLDVCVSVIYFKLLATFFHQPFVLHARLGTVLESFFFAHEISFIEARGVKNGHRESLLFLSFRLFF